MKTWHRFGVLMVCAVCAATCEIMTVKNAFSNDAEIGASNEILMIRGVATPEGGYFLPFYRIPINDRNLQKANKTPNTGTHSVKLIDSYGQVLHQIAWTPVFFSENPEKSSDTTSFSWPVVPKSGIVHVQLEVDDQIVTQFSVETIMPEASDLHVEVIDDPDNSLDQSAELTWSVAQSIGTRSNETPRTLHQLYYSNNDGVNWILVQSGISKSSINVDLSKLPGGSECLLRLTTSDGFNSSHLVSKRFSVADKPPNCVRIAPRFGRTYREGAGVLFIGRCVDLEENVIPEERVTWVSDVQGVLGHGQKIVSRNLQLGKHEITLQSRDLTGNLGKSSPLILEIVR